MARSHGISKRIHVEDEFVFDKNSKTAGIILQNKSSKEITIAKGTTVARVLDDGLDTRTKQCGVARSHMLSKTTKSKVASSKVVPKHNPHGLQPKMSIPTAKGSGGKMYDLASRADPTTLRLMLFDMRDYVDDCCRLYTHVTGCDKFKNVRTPFLPDSSCLPEDDEVAGELKPNACQCLMKCL